MAVSGLILAGFVIAHLLGNLLIYLGPDAINAYAKKLREMGLGLWAARTGLLAAILVHIWTSVQLTSENRRARPQRYARHQLVETTVAARTMMISGIVLVVYLIYHLLHFTFRVTNPEISHGIDRLGRHDVYTMMVLSFQNIYVCAAYVVGVATVCFHLSHGIASAVQTLGFNDERMIARWARAGRLLAFAVFVGYVSIPVSVFLGFIPLAGRFK